MRRQHRMPLMLSEWSSSHSIGEAPWPGLDPDYQTGSCCRTAQTTTFQTGRARTTSSKKGRGKDKGEHLQRLEKVQHVLYVSTEMWDVCQILQNKSHLLPFLDFEDVQFQHYQCLNILCPKLIAPHKSEILLFFNAHEIRAVWDLHPSSWSRLNKTIPTRLSVAGEITRKTLRVSSRLQLHCVNIQQPWRVTELNGYCKAPVAARMVVKVFPLTGGAKHHWQNFSFKTSHHWLYYKYIQL